MNWGPKPFKIFNARREHPEIHPFVEGVWYSTNIWGKSEFVMKEKLKLLKAYIKRWNVEVFGKVDLEVKDAIKEKNISDLEAADLLNQDGGALLACKRLEASKNVWLNLQRIDNILRKS